MRPSKLRRSFLCLFLILTFAASWAPAQEPTPSEFKQLKYRSIGPAAGGRVCRAAGVPGDPLTYYAAVSSGGVWKSSDGGISWKSIFDDQPTQSIGSLAIAPSDPNVIYVGSGEANIRGNVQPGNGIYRSTDAGKTWKHVWKQRGQIGTMIVHPTNPDVAFAAVLGHAFGPNEERGVYRTTDGGKTWQRVLYKNKDTGASDVCFDPNNPRILFAGLWQTRRRPWEMTSGGPGSGLYVSRDGGDSWSQLVSKDAGGRMKDKKDNGTSFGKRSVDLVVVERDQPMQLNSDLDEKIVEQLKKIPGVQAVDFGLTDFILMRKAEGEDNSVIVQGWHSDSFTLEKFQFLSGRKFEMGERGVALLGVRQASILKKKVGDNITVEGESLKVIGIFEGRMGGLENSFVVVPLRELQRMKIRPGRVTGFSIILDDSDGDHVKSVKEAIEALRDEKGRSLRLAVQPLASYGSASSFGLAPSSLECKGLPEGIWGRVNVAVAPSDSRRVYAMIEAENGGLFRSDDGGESWTHINSSRGLRQRAWYFSTITIHPRNADVVYCPQVPLLKSIDGGKTFARVKGTHHGDHHDLWIDPKNPERMIDSNDGGVNVTTNGGQSWYAPPLPICQFYHVACDNRLPYWVSGCIQDIGTASGPSNSLTSEGIPLSAWHSVGGGEAGHTAPDPRDPDIVYAGEYGGYISRYDHRTKQSHSISIFPFNAIGQAGADLKYRFQWTAPLLISPHDHKVIYHAANVLFRTSDRGLKWDKISPDLTRNEIAKQQWSGGPITGDNTGVEIYGTIFALAESPRQKDLLWAGSDDGLVHVSSNGGKKWLNVTPAKMPEWGTVSCIEPSPFEPQTAYVVVDCHRLDDNRPYLFHTTDGGKTWNDLTAGLPNDVYLRAVREDPKKQGQLYLGTSRGVIYSLDAGKTWRALKLNLPAVQVTDLVVKNDDLVLGTEGRSFWILDDLTPIRQMSETIRKQQIHLFEPATAYRYRYAGVLQEGLERGNADNPPHGAILHYLLKTKPRGEVVLEVFDDKEKLVRRLTSKEAPKEPEEEGDYSESSEEKGLPSEAGLHRITWDLRHTGAEIIKKSKTFGGLAKHGPLVLPGVYTLKLKVDGESSTAKLVVKQDPRVKISPEELTAQFEMSLTIRDDVTRLTRTVDQLRSLRRQIQEQNRLLKDHPGAADLAGSAKAVLASMDSLEERLHNPRAKVSYDLLAHKGGAMLYSQLNWLYDQLASSDSPPNQGVREVYDEQRKLLDSYEGRWREILTGDLAKLSEQIRAMGGAIIMPATVKGKNP